jgi:Fe-S-cluster containining protein
VSGELIETYFGVKEKTLLFEHTCRHLGEDNLCKIYEDRPDFCRRFKCMKTKDVEDIINEP